MKQIYASLMMLITVKSFGQLNMPPNSYSAGLGTSITTNIDFAALLSNPSNLGWQHNYYKHQFSFKIFDVSGSYYSPVNANYILNEVVDADLMNDELTVKTPFNTVGEILWSYNTKDFRHDTVFTLKERADMSKRLQEKSALSFNRVLFGASYVSPGHGTFAVQVSNEVYSNIQLSANAANLLLLGKVNPYFDSLVLANGTVIPNTYPSVSNDTLSQIVHAFSNNPITVGQQLNGSLFQFMKTRNFTFGWGNTYKELFAGWQTYIGASINFIQGGVYQDWKTIDNEFYMRDASEVTVENTNKKRSPGKGLSLTFGLSLIKNEKLILGASVRNLGGIRWKYSEENGVIDYNSKDDKLVFDYFFGASPDVSFDDQWAQSNLFISKGTNYTEKGKFYTATPATFAIGAKYLVAKPFYVSLDVITPIVQSVVGSMETVYAALGLELELNKFGLTTGINNNFGQFNVPFGITFGSKKSRFTFNISTFDLANYFRGKEMENLTIGAGLVYRAK